MPNEVNSYRVKNGVKSLETLERLENYSLRWGNYLMKKYDEYKDSSNMLFHHSKYGPSQYHLPKGIGENIGVAMYNEKPTMEEIVTQQMYGIFKGENTNCYTKSYWHNYNILYPNAKYMGCAVFYKYDADRNQWIVFTVQTFDFQLER